MHLVSKKKVLLTMPTQIVISYLLLLHGLIFVRWFQKHCILTGNTSTQTLNDIVKVSENVCQCLKFYTTII